MDLQLKGKRAPDALHAAAAELASQTGRRVVGVVGDTTSDDAVRQTGNTVGSIRNVAVAALTKNMADELGTSGINVTVVHPGVTRTERTAPLAAVCRAASTIETHRTLPWPTTFGPVPTTNPP